jgi:hypothetical protein
MKYSTWKHLEKLRDEKGNEAGKLVQQLLSLAFLDIGAVNLTCRCTEGIDIDFELDGRIWAVEVKKVISDPRNEVSLGDKDFDGLKDSIQRGHKPLIAVLGNQLTDEWLFIPHPGSGLQPSDKTSMPLFRPFQVGDFTGRIREPFEKMVEQHIQVALEKGQDGLKSVLLSHDNCLLA